MFAARSKLKLCKLAGRTPIFCALNTTVGEALRSHQSRFPGGKFSGQ